MTQVATMIPMFVGLNLSDLPEECIATAVSFTTPRDACRLAAVSKSFKSAADSDLVWDRFLPFDHSDILARSYGSGDGDSELLSCLSKKELFLPLVNRPLLIDAGTMSFSLERSTGKKCYTIGARNISIAWGDTPRYWIWPSVPESRFSEVAELWCVCSLQIRGRMKTNMLSPNTPYAAYFVFKIANGRSYYGFYHPVEVAVKTTIEGEVETRSVCLDYSREGHNQSYQIVPKPRGDGWMEVEIGKFSTQREEEDDGEEVEMSVSEVKTLLRKGGLLVEGIEVRPVPVV